MKNQTHQQIAEIVQLQQSFETHIAALEEQVRRLTDTSFDTYEMFREFLGKQHAVQRKYMQLFNAVQSASGLEQLKCLFRASFAEFSSDFAEHLETMKAQQDCAAEKTMSGVEVKSQRSPQFQQPLEASDDHKSACDAATEKTNKSAKPSKPSRKAAKQALSGAQNGPEGQTKGVAAEGQQPKKSVLKPEISPQGAEAEPTMFQYLQNACAKLLKKAQKLRQQENGDAEKQKMLLQFTDDLNAKIARSDLSSGEKQQLWQVLEQVLCPAE